MGIITALIKLTGKLAGEGAEMYVRQSVKGFQEIKIPFSRKISDLKTDHGLVESYVKDLIHQTDNTKSMRAIYDYLKSDRNDLPANVTKQFIKQLNDKAKWVEYNNSVKKIIDSKPDPFAFVSDNAHHVHSAIHHIIESWWV